jgi:hypothetical protein
VTPLHRLTSILRVGIILEPACVRANQSAMGEGEVGALVLRRGACVRGFDIAGRVEGGKGTGTISTSEKIP